MAMLFTAYPDEIRATTPPNGVFKTLAFIEASSALQDLEPRGHRTPALR
jgi:hypothetical protein